MRVFARAVRSAVVIGAALVILCGCAGAPPAGEATSTPTTTTAASVSINGAVITGTGTAMQPGVAFPIPEGDFRSVSLAVQCDGDAPIQVGIDDPAGTGLTLQRGSCGEAMTFSWPLTSSTATSLAVATADGVVWSITPTFSTAEFIVDPAVADDCAAFSAPYGLIYNADIGYSRYDDVDENEWNERIDTAADALSDLADSSTSRLAEPFSDLVSILRDPQRVPGGMMSAMGAQGATISEVCSANQTPVTFDADYGA